MVKGKNGINVYTEGLYIFIDNINGELLLDTITNHMRDIRIAIHVFDLKDHTFDSRCLYFHKFFVPEVYVVLDSILENDELESHGESGDAYRWIISQILRGLKTQTYLKEIDERPRSGSRVDFFRLADLIYEPKPYQMEFFKYYDTEVPRYNLKGALLAAAAGSGKTYISLALTRCLNVDKVIIICPKQAIDRVWREEVRKLFKEKQTAYFSTDEERYNGQHIATYHYESLNKAIEDIILLKGKTAVILDESHNFNNVENKRSLLFHKFITELETDDIIFASGTPVKAIGSELTMLFKCIDPNYDEIVEGKFMKIFHNKSESTHNWLLRTKIHKVSFIVHKKELQIPEPTLIELKIPSKDSKQYTLKEVKKKMSKYIKETSKKYMKSSKKDHEDYYKILDKYSKGFKGKDLKLFKHYKKNILEIKAAYKSHTLNEIKDILKSVKLYEKIIEITLKGEELKKFRHLIALVKYPSFKVQGEALGRVLGRSRIECFKLISQNIKYHQILSNALKKTVIFSSYIEVCEEIINNLPKRYNPSKVYGAFSKDLSSTVKEFMEKESNPLVATYSSLSTAVPLISANTMILIDSPYRSYIQEQAISRIHRLGADAPIFVYEASLDTGDEPNLSTRGIDILKWSQEQVERIVGTKNIFHKEDIDIDENENVSIEKYDVLNYMDKIKRPELFGDW